MLWSTGPGASSPSSPLARVSLTDDAAVKEPGDIGAAFHLRQSREGSCQEGWASRHTPNQPPSAHKPAHWPLPGFCLFQRTPGPTHKIHAVLSQPVETLEEEEEGEERNKAGAEVIPKDREGQTSLSDRVPGTFQKVLGVGQGRMYNSDLLAQLPGPHLWGHNHLTSISAALSCPKNTLPITLPKRKTRTKAWMYRT